LLKREEAVRQKGVFDGSRRVVNRWPASIRNFPRVSVFFEPVEKIPSKL
jgi:hypothetical protein